jgi:hypothetical protein
VNELNESAVKVIENLNVSGKSEDSETSLDSNLKNEKGTTEATIEKLEAIIRFVSGSVLSGS